MSTHGNIEDDGGFDDPALAKPLSAFSPTPLALPGPGGSLRTELIEGLLSGVTYHFALRAVDAEPEPLRGAWSRSGRRNARNFARAARTAPRAPTGLAARAVGRSVALRWNANAEPDIGYYRVWRDLAAPEGGLAAIATAAASAYVDSGVVLGTKQRYRVTAVSSDPAMQSAFSDWVEVILNGVVPREPSGLQVVDTPGGTELRWLPVSRHEDGTPFYSAPSPQPSELSGYRVYHSSGDLNGPWIEAGTVPAPVRVFSVKASDGPPARFQSGRFYQVRAHNSAGLSRPSIVVDVGSGQGHLQDPAGVAMLTLDPSQLHRLGSPSHADESYLLRLSTRPPSGTSTLVAVDFQALQGGAGASLGLDLESFATLRFHLAGREAPPVEAFALKGVRWVQLNGRMDGAGAYAVELRFSGAYELRSSQAAAGGAAAVQLSNRFITPNGDGKNDYAVLSVENPENAEIRGQVFDLRGAFVAELGVHPSLDRSRHRVWDGRSGGAPAPPGVYVYRIEVAARKHQGVIVVLQ